MRWRIFLPTLLVIIICIGWSIMWQVVSGRVDAGVEDWFARERLAGRTWACAERTVSGFPFRIELHCRAPAFAGNVSGTSVTGGMGELLAAAHVYQPSLIVATMTGPLKVTTGGQTSDLTWEVFRVSNRLKGAVLQQFALELDKPVLTLAQGTASPLVQRADRVEVYARPTEDRPDNLEFALRLIKVSAPAADALSGNQDPFDLITRLVATGTGLMEQAPLPQRLEAWRQANGTLDIAEVKFAKADARIEASGRFSLDEAHRPAGNLAIQSVGMEPILKRLGIPPAALAIGLALSGNAAQQNAGPKPLNLSLKVESGRVSVGPMRTPLAVPPLY